MSDVGQEDHEKDKDGRSTVNPVRKVRPRITAPTGPCTSTPVLIDRSGGGQERVEFINKMRRITPFGRPVPKELQDSFQPPGIKFGPSQEPKVVAGPSNREIVHVSASARSETSNKRTADFERPQATKKIKFVDLIDSDSDSDENDFDPNYLSVQISKKDSTREILHSTLERPANSTPLETLFPAVKKLNGEPETVDKYALSDRCQCTFDTRMRQQGFTFAGKKPKRKIVHISSGATVTRKTLIRNYARAANEMTEWLTDEELYVKADQLYCQADIRRRSLRN